MAVVARLPVLLATGEEAGRLDGDVNSQLAPRKVAGILLGTNGDFLAIHHQAIGLELDRSRKATLHRVILQQHRQGFGAPQIVDGDHFELAGTGSHDAKQNPPDPPKPVDAYANSHKTLLV